MYHSLDTPLFKVYSPDSGVITTYGRFRLKHELHQDPPGSGTWFATMNRAYECCFVSVDGKDFEKYDYDWTAKNQALAKELNQEILKDIAARRLARNKEMAARRIENDKKDAKKRGLTVEDVKAERKAQRQVEVEESKLEERVEYTKRLMKAAPMIRILHDDLADILKKIERGEPIRIGHVDSGLRRLEKAQTIVARWRKSYQRARK